MAVAHGIRVLLSFAAGSLTNRANTTPAIVPRPDWHDRVAAGPDGNTRSSEGNTDVRFVSPRTNESLDLRRPFGSG